MACVVNSVPSSAHLKSVERVHNYPLVNDSFVFALGYYNWAKSKNIILDATLNKLEGVLKTVKDKTEPIAAERLHYFDDSVCNQLERFEKLCPIILKPSKNITDIPSNIYHQRIEPSIQRVAHPVALTLNFVTRTSCVTASMMSSIIKNVIPTSMCPTTSSVLHKTEQLLDRYFPDPNAGANDKCSECQDEGIYEKIRHLSIKTQRRILKKVTQDIAKFRKASLEKLEHIYKIIQELKRSQSSVTQETTVASAKESSRNEQLIKDGVHYTDHLRLLITSTAKSMPKFVCSTAVSALDVLNERLFVVRNTIQESTNRRLLSDKRISQAADTIDFVRSWIEYFTDNLQEYCRQCEKKGDDDVCDVERENDVDGQDSTTSEEEEEEEEGEN